MDNYTKYTDNYALSLDSAGVAQKKFNTYQESSQAHLDRFVASWQNLGKAIIDSELIKTLLDIGTALSKVAVQLGLFVSFIAGFLKINKILGVSVVSSTTKFANMGVAIKGVGVAASIMALAFGAALVVLVGSMLKAVQADTELRQSLEDTNKAYSNYLTDPNDENFQNFKIQSDKRIALLQKELDKLNEVKNIYKTLSELKPGNLFGDMGKIFSEENIRGLFEGLNGNGLGFFANIFDVVSKGKSKSVDINKSIFASMFPSTDSLIKKTEDAIKTVEDTLKNAPTPDIIAAKSKGTILPSSAPTIKTAEDIAAALKAQEDAAAALDVTLKELDSEYKDHVSSIKGYQSEMKSMVDLYDKINDGGKISNENLIDLLLQYPEYNSQIMASIGNKESELSLTELLFEANKQKAIAEQQAAIENIKTQIKLNNLNIDAFNLSKQQIEQASLFMSKKDPQRKAMEDYLNSNASKMAQGFVDEIEARTASIGVLKKLKMSDFNIDDTKEEAETAFKLAEKHTLAIKDADNAITKAEGESLESQLKAKEAKEAVLKSIISQISDEATIKDLQGDINALVNDEKKLREDIIKRDRDGRIATLEANIEAAKNISKDAEIKATQALIDYLKDVGVQLVKEKASQEDIANNAKEIANLEGNILSIVKDVTEEKEKQIDTQIQSIKDQIADDKFHLEAQQKIAEDALDDKIRLINLEIDALEDKNETLKEEEERQQKILDILKEKDNLANTLKEKNTKMLTEKGWEWIANPKAVRESQEKVKQLESDMASWEAENTRKKVIKEKQAKIVAIEEQKRLLQVSYDAQYTIIDNTLHKIEEAEKGSFAIRMAEVTKFVAEYNAKMAQMVGAITIPSGGGSSSSSNVSSSGSASQNYAIKNTSIIDAANDMIREAQKEWNAATTQAAKDAAHKKAESARALIVGEQYKTTSASGVSQYTDATGMLIRDSGGIMPDGSTSLNLSGKPELALNNSQVGKVYNLIKALPPMALTGGMSSASSSLGYNFSGPIYVTANNADQFMESMRNYTRLTRK